MHGAVEWTFDSDLRGVIGILAPWGIAPGEACLEVVHAVLEPFAQFAETRVTIDVLVAIDLVETAAPTSVGGVFVTAKAIVDAVEERWRVAFADQRLGVAGSERILAVVHIVSDDIVRRSHRAIVPRTREVMAEQNGHAGVMTLDVTAARILVPDAVEHGLSAGTFVLVGVLRLNLLKGLGSRVHAAPSLQIDGTRIVVGEEFHNAVGPRCVRPVGGVDDGFGTRKQMACDTPVELHMLGILVADIDHAAQIVGGGVVGIMHLQVGINLLVGVELFGEPGLGTPSVALIARVALDDGSHLHVVRIEQEVDHRTAVVGLGIGHHHHTGHTAHSLLLLGSQYAIIGVGQWLGSLM